MVQFSYLTNLDKFISSWKGSLNDGHFWITFFTTQISTLCECVQTVVDLASCLVTAKGNEIWVIRVTCLTNLLIGYSEVCWGLLNNILNLIRSTIGDSSGFTDITYNAFNILLYYNMYFIVCTFNTKLRSIISLLITHTVTILVFSVCSNETFVYTEVHNSIVAHELNTFFFWVGEEVKIRGFGAFWTH